MMIRTANGSLMKVTEMEGQRMLDEHPFDYYHELDACEVCEKDSWTTCAVHVQDKHKEWITIRKCYSCYIAAGGTDEGWGGIVDSELMDKYQRGCQ